ncbi:hypothetical protein ABPG75_007707 [Micractinium tetrahymenae]
MLSGNLSAKERAKRISEFQNDPPTTIFLLTAASHSPSGSTQIDIALLSPCPPAVQPGTVEARIRDLLQQRQQGGLRDLLAASAVLKLGLGEVNVGELQQLLGRKRPTPWL